MSRDVVRCGRFVRYESESGVPSLSTSGDTARARLASARQVVNVPYCRVINSHPPRPSRRAPCIHIRTYLTVIAHLPNPLIAVDINISRFTVI